MCKRRGIRRPFSYSLGGIPHCGSAHLYCFHHFCPFPWPHHPLREAPAVDADIEHMLLEPCRAMPGRDDERMSVQLLCCRVRLTRIIVELLFRQSACI